MTVTPPESHKTEQGDSPFNPGEFTFSPGIAEESKDELDKKLNALGSRIEGILMRAVIKDVPILRHIVNFTNDKEDLEMLGKACLRMSELIPELEDLQKKRELIEVSLKNPDWVYSVFADLSDQSDEVESFLKEN